jgi:cellulose synthase/poly-beta-1,6-N-acetylglucosamine synthase-like glycosyltransferase
MLITMAVYDTEENDRTWMTVETLDSLYKQVDFSRHRLMVSDNGSCEATQRVLHRMRGMIDLTVHNGENLGTAAALNKLWRHRKPGEVVCKIDNDVVVHARNWPDYIEKAFKVRPFMGICGLKRKDCDEWPLVIEPKFLKSKFLPYPIYPLPHVKGHPWRFCVLEQVNHVMGTCQAYRPELLDKIGYLYQPSKYGFDDSLAAVRCEMAGFFSAFLTGIEIDHIDPGGTEHTDWKNREAGRMMNEYHKTVREYKSEKRDIYYDGGFGD